jgi:transposase
MPLRLSIEERQHLKHLARRARDARVLRRIQAVLDIDAGETAEHVAQRYQVTRSTIYNWIKRCRSRGLSQEAFRDLPRPGRRSARERDVQGGNQNHI